jgi:hypothetical protein
VIDDVEYELSTFFADTEFEKIKPGYSGAFYLGLNDEIIATAELTAVMKYGYLVKADTGKRLSSKLQLKIFTTSGNMEVFECADKVRIDGVMMDDLKVIYETYLTKTQLLKYAVNADGKISALDFAETTRFYKSPEKEKFDVYNNLERNVLSGSYRHRGNNFSAYFFSSNAVTLVVPPSEDDRGNEEKYSVGYSFGDDQIVEDGVGIEVYDVGYDGNAKLIIAYVDSTDSSNVPITGAQSVIVESVFNKRDSDGFFRQAIRGWSDGQFIEYILDDTVEVKKFGANATLECGDFIRVLRSENTVKSLVVAIIGKDFIQNMGVSMIYNQDRATTCY